MAIGCASLGKPPKNSRKSSCSIVCLRILALKPSSSSARRQLAVDEQPGDLEEAGRAVELPRGRLPADLRRAAHRGASWPTSRTRSAGTRCCTRTCKRFFDGFPRDAHPMAMLSSAVSALSTFYQDSLDPFDAEHVRSPRSGCWPSCRRSRRTRTRSRSGSRSSTRTTPRLRRELPAMTFAVPAEQYERRPGRVRRWTCCSCCTPTTSRTARPPRCGWSARPGEPVRVDLGRHRRAVGPAARRRQPGGAGDAGGHPGRRRRRRRVRPQGQGQGGGRPADGLRPPGLQELRPARGDRQEGRRTTCSSGSASPTRCSTSP